ncbi:MAG: RagB/SusD family nutrient uptake outer membrane protein [Bacteroidales bacterium]|nr:RagB/SusD family nutrient uptake outer membrane protein [Bacteroidales bacterium]
MAVFKHIRIIAAALLCSACFNLDEHVYSDIPMDKFFTNETEVISNAARAYMKLQGYCGEQSLWTLLLQASDECAIKWYSNGRYEQIQINEIPPTNKLVRLGWEWVFNSISACNEVIYETESSEIEFEGKNKVISEIKLLRAYLYYCGMSNWGNIPFCIDYTMKGYPEQKDRAFVYNFLIEEIKANIDNLDSAPSAANYGRFTQAAAWTLLAKLYINAGVWFGTPEWEKAADACNHVISSGNYIIEDKYDTNFDIDNDKSKENIFSIIYDRVYTSGEDTSFYLHVLTLEAESKATFNIPYDPWSGFICQPDFFQLYQDGDKRKDATWLYGDQFDINGKPLGFAYEAVFDESQYFFSNGGPSKFQGARCWKWHFQTDGSLSEYTISQDNDFALFRYADVVLMYVECLLRLNRKDEAVVLDDFKKIRTRAGLAPYTAEELTLDELYNERGRELAWEGIRHEDMIRYGKYLGKYWAHEAQDEEFRLLFPIPVEAINSNKNLVQNPGYVK